MIRAVFPAFDGRFSAASRRHLDLAGKPVLDSGVRHEPARVGPFPNYTFYFTLITHTLQLLEG